MDKLNKNIDKFLKNESMDDKNEEVCDVVTGVCYMKTKDGLIERKMIEQKLITEDGRELLREDNPITHTRRTFIR